MVDVAIGRLPDLSELSSQDDQHAQLSSNVMQALEVSTLQDEACLIPIASASASLLTMMSVFCCPALQQPRLARCSADINCLNAGIQWHHHPGVHLSLCLPWRRMQSMLFPWTRHRIVLPRGQNLVTARLLLHLPPLLPRQQQQLPVAHLRPQRNPRQLLWT